jgi:hypothetical protein
MRKHSPFCCYADIKRNLGKSVRGYAKIPFPDHSIRLLFHTNRIGAKNAPQRRRIGMVALYEKQRKRILACAINAFQPIIIIVTGRIPSVKKNCSITENPLLMYVQFA